MSGSADHGDIKLFAAGSLRKLGADVRSARLDGRDAVWVKLDGWAVDEKLPLDLTALFAVVLADAAEFSLALLNHLS